MLKGEGGMNENKIVIPAKALSHLQPGQSGMLRLKPKAYNALVDLANESGMTLSGIASEVIIQAIDKNLIQFDRQTK